jgi:hypothetical protein
MCIMHMMPGPSSDGEFIHSWMGIRAGGAGAMGSAAPPLLDSATQLLLLVCLANTCATVAPL